jgi:hypothetical protein
VNYKTKKIDNELRVTVTLPKLTLTENTYSVFPTQVLSLVEKEYDILSFIDCPVAKSSHEKEVVEVFKFLLKKERKKSVSKRNSKKNLEQPDKKQEDVKES